MLQELTGSLGGIVSNINPDSNGIGPHLLKLLKLSMRILTESSVKILLEFWKNPGRILVESWQNSGRILAES